jgi:uncharacterized protein YuzE
LGPEFRATTAEPAIRYYPDTDTMAIEIRDWPDIEDGNRDEIGGEDAGEDLVIHYAADGQPWLWEIEHASLHPEHIAVALAQIRRRNAVAA